MRRVSNCSVRDLHQNLWFITESTERKTNKKNQGLHVSATKLLADYSGKIKTLNFTQFK